MSTRISARGFISMVLVTATLTAVLTAIVTAGALPPAAAFPPDKQPAGQTLRYRFTKGQTIAYELSQDAAISQSIANGIELSMKQTTNLSITVQDVLNDGTAKIVWKFGRIRMDMAGPLALHVDTAAANDPDNGPGKDLAAVMRSLARLEFTAVMKPTGALSDVKAPADVLKELQQMPNAGQLGEMLSEDGLANTMRQTLPLLPATPVSEGFVWSQKITNKSPFGSATNTITYTYRGSEIIDNITYHKIATSVAVAISVDPEAPAVITVREPKKKPEEGVMLFDNTAGRVQQLTQRQSIEMTISAGANRDLEQSVRATTTMKLIDKK